MGSETVGLKPLTTAAQVSDSCRVCREGMAEHADHLRTLAVIAEGIPERRTRRPQSPCQESTSKYTLTAASR